MKKGSKMSKESRLKMSLAKLGKPSNFKGKTRTHTPEEIEKMKLRRQAYVGDKSPNWRGGVTSAQKRIRDSKEYKEWRKSVFVRDNYTCQECGYRGNKLNADHIKQFAYYPELRLDINNGKTLCVPCHRKTPTYGRSIRVANSTVENLAFN